jgi:predicted DsbA family dithiol-disulfide isomerase
VNKFTHEIKKKVIHHNYHKRKAKAQEEKEVEELKNKFGVLKENMKEYETEIYALKEEKKNEYMLFNLLKEDAANKDKLERIKLICDE